MRIVDRATFLAMPPGTVYAKYEPCFFGELLIKDATWPSSDDVPAHGDWLYQNIVDSLAMKSGSYEDGDVCSQMEDLTERSLATGSSIPMDFNSLGRDGEFEPGQLFAVWEPQDVRALIERLQRALNDTEASDGR